MSQYFTSYDDDGRIVATGRAVNPHEQAMESGGVFVGAVFDGDRFYFLNGVPTPRPDAPAITLSAASIPANGTSTILLQGVPAGAKVIFGGQELIANGDDIELTTLLVGVNRVMVDAFPAKMWTGTFDGAAN